MKDTIKALLREYGNSTALAAKLGVTSRAVEHWASGARSPRTRHREALERLARSPKTRKETPDRG